MPGTEIYCPFNAAGQSVLVLKDRDDFLVRWQEGDPGSNSFAIPLVQTFQPDAIPSIHSLKALTRSAS